MPTFGELIRRLRGSRTQREVASDLAMPVTTLSTLENQEAVPRGRVLKRLADYYGVSLAYFHEGSAPEPKSTDPARQWLLFVSKDPTVKDAIATLAPPDYPEAIKKQFAEKIRKKKHAKISHSR